MPPILRGLYEFLFFDRRKRSRRPDIPEFPGEVVAECDDIFDVTIELDNVFDVETNVVNFDVEIEQDAVFAIAVEIDNDVFELVIEELPI